MAGGNVQLTPSDLRVLFFAEAVGATFESQEFPGAELYGTFGIQVILSSAAAANYSFQIKGSLDGVNYGDFGAPQVLTADGSILFNVTGFGCPHLKVVGTRTAGTGTFKILAYGKQL